MSALRREWHGGGGGCGRKAFITFSLFPCLGHVVGKIVGLYFAFTHTAEDYDDDVIKGGIKQGERAESPIVGTRKFTEKSLDEEESEDERLKAFPG